MTASVHFTEDLLFSTLLQLIVMILCARVGNNIARRMEQPGAVGEIVAGLMLGPSLFGHYFPQSAASIFGKTASTPITIISQIGLVFLMFQIGTDFEFGLLSHRRNRNATIRIAVASIGVPFTLGFLVGNVSASVLAPNIDALIYSLFLGVGMAITAVPTLGRILREYDLTRTEVGVVAISAAAINDVAGWVLLAGIAAYASAQFSVIGMGAQVAGIVGLLAVAWFALRPLVGWLLRKYPIRNNEVPSNLIAIVICLIFAAGICTYKLGIFAIFGGFLVGLLFHHYKDFVSAWRHQIGQFVLVFFLPVFFTYTGLRTNVLGLVSATDWQWLIVVLAAATLGKIIPVYFTARFSGFSQGESMVLGSLMNTRALMELIVLNVGYDMGFIPQNVFTILVIMAVATTIMTGPLLKILLPRTGHSIPVRVEA